MKRLKRSRRAAVLSSMTIRCGRLSAAFCIAVMAMVATFAAPSSSSASPVGDFVTLRFDLQVGNQGSFEVIDPGAEVVNLPSPGGKPWTFTVDIGENGVSMEGTFFFDVDIPEGGFGLLELHPRMEMFDLDWLPTPGTITSITNISKFIQVTSDTTGAFINFGSPSTSRSFVNQVDGTIVNVSLNAFASVFPFFGPALGTVSGTWGAEWAWTTEHVAAIPLPAAAWMAIPLLGGLGISRFVKRRCKT